MTTRLVEPHGGTLVDRFVPDAEAASLAARADKLVTITLDARERADLELIATGAASPLTGFLGSADYESVLSRMRLADGTVWPLPFTLAVDDALRAHLEPGQDAALEDASGHIWGTIRVSEIYRRNAGEEVLQVYRTEDPAHPGVAYLLSRPPWLVAGEVSVLPTALRHLPFAEHRRTPRELRAEISARGWRQVAGFQTRNPIHRAHEHLTKLALEITDGLVIHPLVGETKGDDVPAAVRFRAYETLVERYYPKDRTLLSAFPAAMRYAGPREALFHAIARKNYGIDRLIVGRDHAGVGSFYGPYEAQEIFDRFTIEEVGVAPLKLEPTFFCRACAALASARTCPHGPKERLELSGSKVRELLRAGEHLPEEFTRREVAEVLRAHYVASGGAPAIASPGNGNGNGHARRPAAENGNGQRRPRGFILWFTGLSGAGKTTLALALKERLQTGRSVEILDGDEVRTNLSKGLGFSREDRDTNIRRIGFVARLLARHGVAAIGAAISPYAATRAEVRALAEKEGIAFLEVFADAGLETLVERDVKGLYRKALAGELPHFTGVSDPYEAPEQPDLRLRTDQEGVERSLARILDLLAARGLAPAPAPEAAEARA
jgi:sulfate adenylyltransferase